MLQVWLKRLCRSTDIPRRDLEPDVLPTYSLELYRTVGDCARNGQAEPFLCPKCGTSNPPTARFCKNCGHKREAQEARRAAPRQLGGLGTGIEAPRTIVLWRGFTGCNISPEALAWKTAQLGCRRLLLPRPERSRQPCRPRQRLGQRLCHPAQHQGTHPSPESHGSTLD